MASNRLPDQNDRLFALAEDMADGLNANQGPVGIKQNKENDFRPDITTAEAAEVDYQNKRQAKVVATSQQTVADSNGKALIAAAKRVIEHHIGAQWSQAWATAGFTNGTTAIPSKIDERQTCLAMLKAYFTTNAGHENAPLNVTAAQADTLFQALSDKRSAVNAAINAVAAAKTARDVAVDKLRTRMRGLITELEQLLDDDDARWYAFGLNRPSDPEAPGIPDGLVLTPGMPGTVLVDCADARRADRYRVFKQVVGVDPDFVGVLSVTESDATLTGLPSGATVKVRMTAVNDAGESQPSTEAQIVVP
jgi:hypothetical protein